jgi:2-methylcitrate dehydratase
VEGFLTWMTGMCAVSAAPRAKRGFTWPRGLFKGSKGLEQMFVQSIVMDPDDPSLELVKQRALKKYWSLFHDHSVRKQRWI